MKHFIVENTLERGGDYTKYSTLRLLQLMSLMMYWSSWCLNKAGPALRSWSEKLKQHVLEKLETRELSGVSLDDDIVKPTQSEKQSDWKGHPPKVRVVPLSTGKTGPRVEDEVSEVTVDKTDSTEETGNITKDTPAPLSKGLEEKESNSA